MPTFRLFNRIVKAGSLTIVDAAGRPRRFGGAPLPGVSPVTIRLHDPGLHWRLGLRPNLTLGEAYVDGTLTVEDGTLYDFLALCAENAERVCGSRALSLLEGAGRLLRRVQQFNPAGRARGNVKHHYDLSDALYELFLDADRQYSCAYFEQPGMTLEQAQEAKKRHIAAKLLLGSGQRVLDIGCGWGGLALSLSTAADVDVTGITLSEEQLKVASARAARQGLQGRVRFRLEDYRAVQGRYDRIVSVGMFEHVGVNHYRTFFERLREMLAEDGVAVLHSIGRSDGPGATNPWVRRYIFPGGYIPALSEVFPAVEAARLFVTDVEILRLHYAETVREWRRRFAANRAAAAALYDERFCRMWEFYLAGAEVAFRHQGMMVFQMQLARRQDAVPPTRHYMYRQAASEAATAAG